MSRTAVLVTTAKGGGYDALYEIGKPKFQAFCDAHGYDLHHRETVVEHRGGAWGKVPAMLSLLQGDDAYDRLILFDADTVIAKPEAEFPWDAMGAATHAISVHHTIEGVVPNTGVWAVTQAAVPLLYEIWTWPNKHNGQFANEPWMEQSAYMAIQGYGARGAPCLEPDVPAPGLYDLPIAWNCPWNYPELDDAIVKHAGGIADIAHRIALMEGWAAE